MSKKSTTPPPVPPAKRRRMKTSYRYAVVPPRVRILEYVRIAMVVLLVGTAYMVPSPIDQIMEG